MSRDNHNFVTQVELRLLSACLETTKPNYSCGTTAVDECLEKTIAPYQCGTTLTSGCPETTIPPFPQGTRAVKCVSRESHNPILTLNHSCQVVVQRQLKARSVVEPQLSSGCLETTIISYPCGTTTVKSFSRNNHDSVTQEDSQLSSGLVVDRRIGKDIMWNHSCLVDA